MEAKKPLIGIFDLDGTLGWKTPTYPNITKENGDFLRYFSSLANVMAILATGKPRTHARVGFKKGNIAKEEIYVIFAGGVFEDGLFVEDSNGQIYNALDEASEEFRRLRSAFFDEQAQQFFKERGFKLFPGHIVRQVETTGGIRYEVLDYDEKFISVIEEDLSSAKGILYEQGNDVRATYKLPLGFAGDDLEKQRPVFEQLEPLVVELMRQHYADYEKHGTLVKWEDAIEIYPVLGEETFRKGVGVEMVLERIDPNRESTLIFCCDGKNDISLVNHLGKSYRDNHIIIAPSNASDVLKREIEQHNEKHGKKGYVLDVDCTQFGKGANNLLRELGYLG